MVHRNPASMDAPMTTRKPTRSNSVSPATSSSRPSAMITTTPAKPQLGLHGCMGRPIALQYSPLPILPVVSDVFMGNGHAVTRFCKHAIRLLSMMVLDGQRDCRVGAHRSKPQTKAKTSRKTGVADLHMV